MNLPPQAQTLYIHLCMAADDEGMLSDAMGVMRHCRARYYDLERLKSCGYIRIFDSGVVFITHWYIHNRIRKDRFKPSIFKKERILVSEMKPEGYPNFSEKFLEDQTNFKND